VLSKRTKFGDLNVSGSNALRQAIGSTANIANISIGGDARSDDAELETIVGILRSVHVPLPVAEMLKWDSAKAADALARGGQRGVLIFSKDGDTTMVTIDQPS
jgi:imidazolonepropionase-like amidohydrolase